MRKSKKAKLIFYCVFGSAAFVYLNMCFLASSLNPIATLPILITAIFVFLGVMLSLSLIDELKEVFKKSDEHEAIQKQKLQAWQKEFREGVLNVNGKPSEIDFFKQEMDEINQK